MTTALLETVSGTGPSFRMPLSGRNQAAGTARQRHQPGRSHV